MTDPVRPPPACSGIVLAGGRSTRFGRDKLAEPFDGRPLVDHAIGTVAAIASEVILVVPPDAVTSTDRSAEARIPPDDSWSSAASSRGSHARLVVIHDPESYGGPRIGLLAGLGAAREPLAMVVGGDMPGLHPEVLALMLARLEAMSDVDAVALDDGGRIRPLPLAVRVGAGTAAASAAVGRGARSLHALLDGLRIDTLTERTWRALDPGGDTLRDIDHPSDLDAVPG